MDHANTTGAISIKILNLIVIESFRNFFCLKFLRQFKKKNTAFHWCDFEFPAILFLVYSLLHDISHIYAHFQVRVMVFYSPFQQFRFTWYIYVASVETRISSTDWKQNILPLYSEQWTFEIRDNNIGHILF